MRYNKYALMRYNKYALMRYNKYALMHDDVICGHVLKIVYDVGLLQTNGLMKIN